MSDPYGTINKVAGLGATVGALGMAGSFIGNQVKRTQRKVSKRSNSTKRKSNTKGKVKKRR